MNNVTPQTSARPEPPAAKAPDWAACAVFLDFDGTLAPFCDQPDAVALPARERRAVQTLLDRCDGAVAIVTGRALSDIARLTEGLPLVLAGSHGLELRWPDGTTEVPDDVAAVLDAPHERLADFAATHGLLIERKPGAIALHYRTAPDKGDAVRAATEDAAEGNDDLRVIHGNMVSEVALSSIDKGSALARLMKLAPFAGRTPVMVGDDRTDEDGITEAQALGGTGIRIGDPDSPAHIHFADREGFCDWLSSSLEVV